MRKPINRNQLDYSVRSIWVRHRIVKSKGCKVRVLIYARYSTDEQNPRSVQDQVLYCKKFLMALGLKDEDLVITVICDEGISGERIFRPGINQVREGIEAGLWDIIVVEDCGRLFRVAAATIGLVNDAVDRSMRVFCINDEVDTADEEYWEDRLYEAARHHERSNKFTSRRIKRAHEALWEMGAAIGLLKPGYQRKPKHPVADGETQEGPYVDEIDPKWQAVIYELYERIAAGESPWAVADWLTSISFPKASNFEVREHTDKNVVSLIRRTDYRGFQSFRDRVSKKVRKTGAKRAERNSRDEVLTRDMPHLRIVPDWLWYAANKAIDARAPVQKNHHDLGKTLRDKPRDSRGVLSNIFFCSCCGNGKMHREVRTEGGYRCSNVRRRKCWNKATCLVKYTEKPICEAVAKRLGLLDQELDRLVAQATSLLGDSSNRRARQAELLSQIGEHESIIYSLRVAIEKSNGQVLSLIDPLIQRESELAVLRGELEGITSTEEWSAPPTRPEIEERIASLTAALAGIDVTARDTLAALVGIIRAVPHLQFGGNKVVLRARFELNLAALLPSRTRATLAGLHGDLKNCGFDRIEMAVNLFEPSTGPRYGLSALALKLDKGLGLTAIGKQLGINKRQANIAIQYGERLRAAGLTDPYVELASAPENVSRWRSRAQKPPIIEGDAENQQ